MVSGRWPVVSRRRQLPPPFASSRASAGGNRPNRPYRPHRQFVSGKWLVAGGRWSAAGGSYRPRSPPRQKNYPIRHSVPSVSSVSFRSAHPPFASSRASAWGNRPNPPPRCAFAAAKSPLKKTPARKRRSGVIIMVTLAILAERENFTDSEAGLFTSDRRERLHQQGVSGWVKSG